MRLPFAISEKQGASAGDVAGARALARGSGRAFAVGVGGAVLGLLVNVLLARLLGARAYGTYALALTWVSVLSMMALLGQDNGVVRLVPRYVQRAAWAELRGLRRRMGALVAAASGVLSLGGAICIFLFRGRLGAELALTLAAAFVLLPVFAQLQLSGALHRGLKRAASSCAFNSLLRPAVLGVLVLALVLHRGLSAPLAMAASCLGALVALGGSEWLLARAWPAEAKRVQPRYDTGAWLGLGLQLFLLTAVGMLLNSVDVLILGGLGGAAQVGPYYAAVRLGGFAAYGLNAVNVLLAPMIAERYAASDHAGLRQLVRHGARLTFGITVVAALGAALLGRRLLGLFGPGFEAAYGPLLIILAAQCVSAAAGPVGYVMTMTRFERQAPLIFAAGALLNVALSFLLVPGFGMLGAAIAAACATLGWKLAAFVLIRRQLGVNPTILPLSTHETSQLLHPRRA
ncbi:MAG: lipopolysaccharide biosynthesis protein [Betaproteobacteria bacterium]|nr:lipopolysaccharide biosynthesis protein [Betaproteobacteria bacterium]